MLGDLNFVQKFVYDTETLKCPSQRNNGILRLVIEFKVKTIEKKALLFG